MEHSALCLVDCEIYRMHPFTRKLWPDIFRQLQTCLPHLTVFELVGVSKWNAAPSVLLTMNYIGCILLPRNLDPISFAISKHGSFCLCGSVKSVKREGSSICVVPSNDPKLSVQISLVTVLLTSKCHRTICHKFKRFWWNECCLPTALDKSKCYVIK